MRTFRFDKIVRNAIPAKMENSGAVVRYRALSPEETGHLLLEKLIEEAREAQAASPDERAAEFADLRAVLKAAELALGLSDEAITGAEQVKYAKGGDFSSIVYVETMTIPDDDPWVEYFLTYPDKYPEIPLPPE